MQRHAGALREAGAQAVAIGQGTGAEAARVARMLHLEYACLGDPERASYRALGLGRAGWWGLVVQPFLDDPSGAARNVRDADLRASMSPRSDVKQLGGVALIDRGGVLRYLHRAASPTDLPDTAELVERARTLS